MVNACRLHELFSKIMGYWKSLRQKLYSLGIKTHSVTFFTGKNVSSQGFKESSVVYQLMHIRNDLIRLERKLRKELQSTLQHEELLWYQRSREEWITSGDSNTKFYHTATSVKKNKTRINSLLSEEGIWISDKNLLLNHVRNFFERLFSEAHCNSNQHLPHG